jgi:hypothetical protein
MMSADTSPTPPAVRKVATTTLLAVGVVAVIVVVAALGLLFHPHPSTAPSNGNGTILAPAGTSWGIQAEQFEAISFDAAQSTQVTTQFSTSFNISVYVMSQSELESFSVTNNISGYEWYSGVVPTLNIDHTVSSGDWALVFYDASPVRATNVLLLSPVVIAAQ